MKDLTDYYRNDIFPETELVVMHFTLPFGVFYDLKLGGELFVNGKTYMFRSGEVVEILRSVITIKASLIPCG